MGTTGRSTGRRAALAAGLLLAVGVAGVASGAVRTIERKDLCVTTGQVTRLADDRLGIEEPEVRAVVLADSTQAAEMRFTYLGPSARTKALGSGEIRRQIGIKLRAQDSCNLLYVMWRIEPRDQIVVSVKSNPGQRTHAECGTHGYTNLKPERRRTPGPAAAAPAVTAGSTHDLRADLVGRELRVWADGAIAWEGQVPATIQGFDGPVGLRTDNVRAQVAYRIGGGPPAPLSKVSDWLRQRCGADSREGAD
jgi:hypothetical protein